MTTPEEHRAHEGYRASVATLEIWRIVPTGPMTSKSMVVGEVMVEVCNTCLYTVTTCMHTKNTWHDDGTVLRCDVCGLNGT